MPSRNRPRCFADGCFNLWSMRFQSFLDIDNIFYVQKFAVSLYIISYFVGAHGSGTDDFVLCVFAKKRNFI